MMYLILYLDISRFPHFSAIYIPYLTNRVIHSPIQGFGVIPLRPIQKGEMVIEYMGEIIGNAVSDKRERAYDRKRIGCYMFRVKEDYIIDATMKGNRARFINHSCDVCT
jgi:histone-lysine N-methyltransferase MLL1